MSDSYLLERHTQMRESREQSPICGSCPRSNSQDWDRLEPGTQSKLLTWITETQLLELSLLHARIHTSRKLTQELSLNSNPGSRYPKQQINHCVKHMPYSGLLCDS